jgi:cell volume regulation protein A
VPIILATFPLVAGIEKADTIFHLVFFIALTSVVMQGTAIPWLTRLLKISDPPPNDIRPGPQSKPQAPPRPMP